MQQVLPCSGGSLGYPLNLSGPNQIYIKLDDVTNLLVVIDLDGVVGHALKPEFTSFPQDNSLPLPGPRIRLQSVSCFECILEPSEV